MHLAASQRLRHWLHLPLKALRRPGSNTHNTHPQIKHSLFSARNRPHDYRVIKSKHDSKQAGNVQERVHTITDHKSKGHVVDHRSLKTLKERLSAPSYERS